MSLSIVKMIFLSFLLSVSISRAIGQGIKFQSGTWTDIQVRGNTDHKLIFVDIYAVWCGPCKAMAKNVFTQAKVADHFNSQYVNFAVDAEKGDGIDLAKRYGVESFPTYLFIDGTGKLVYRIEGALAADAFLAEAEKADEKFRK